MQGSPRGGAWGGSRGGFNPILPKIICYINSGVFNSGEFKNDLYFHFRVPRPSEGRPQGGGRGGFSPILPKIICYIDSGVFKSEDFKNDLYFYFRVPPTPARAPTGGGLGGAEGGLVL